MPIGRFQSGEDESGALRHHTSITVQWRCGLASIRQFPNGRWQAQVRRRGIRPLAKTFETRQDALRWARHAESEMDRGMFLDRSEAERTTLAEIIERYLAEVTPLKKSARSE